MLNIECCKENFNILVNSLNVLYNYFNDLNNIIFKSIQIFRYFSTKLSFLYIHVSSMAAVRRKNGRGGILREEKAAPLGILKTRENQGRGRKKKGLPRGGNPLLIFF